MEPAMPTQERVRDFVTAVREGRYVEAIEAFYAEDATMRENLGPPRGGRDVLIQHETAVLASLQRMATHAVGPVLIDGERVVINWVFEMTGRDGVVRRMDELALQTWRDDRIVEEQFYYDPSQLTAAA
jgi:ketosteroid isomerase-like protein